ncbi:hypothetical protein ACFUMJ_14295 [Streptomyces olivaceus]|uniref:hypothetical protein n=1 Tax=Streptomyces TaxID=1883 RepID=UPI001FB62DEA|nr:hypothetical protein [Streptomyces sp. CB09030]UOG80118.1 hypothetical protein L6J92_13335 [Streptomyces sp. CB09030]
MPAEARRRIADRYELLEPLSHGSMRDVWRGFDARAGATGKEPIAPRDAGHIAEAPVPALAPAQREELREQIREVHDNCAALWDEDRFSQASEMIEAAAQMLGSKSRAVLALRKRRAFSRQLAGDPRAALPEFEALADASDLVSGPHSQATLGCGAQAARSYGELGRVTEALAGLEGGLRPYERSTAT